MDKIYKYPSCFGVSGYSRSIIQDSKRNNYIFSPIWLTSVLENKEHIKISEFKKLMENNNVGSQFENYLKFLTDNEIIYISHQNISFQKLPLIFETPSLITNAIFIFRDINFVLLKKLIKEVEDLGCEHIQLYFPILQNRDIFFKLMSLFDNTIIQSLELITGYNSVFNSLKKVSNLFSKQNRLFKLYLTNSPEQKKEYVDEFLIKFVLYSDENFDFTHCGDIHPAFFINNLSFYTESQAHNTCLNRKISIDDSGNIKNCPAMQQSFGNIKDTTLKEATEKQGFKDFWFIHKDMIDVCKDCEFRYMCTDCRCFIKDPENIYSQPSKCIFNPYICKWQGEEGYVPVEECGTYSRETCFVPDKTKIEALNKQIWGEDNE